MNSKPGRKWGCLITVFWSGPRGIAQARLAETSQPIPDPVPRVFLGAIAAGEQVVASTQSESYQLIRNAYSDALAVEMESYGFLKAAQAHSGLEALAVRGISDLLEGKAEADKGVRSAPRGMPPPLRLRCWLN